MTIDREAFDKLLEKHSNLILDDTDAEHALLFAWDVICAEVDAMKEKYPYATKSISDLEKAEHIVYDLSSDISAGKFEETEDD